MCATEHSGAQRLEARQTACRVHHGTACTGCRRNGTSRAARTRRNPLRAAVCERCWYRVRAPRQSVQRAGLAL